MNKQNQETDPLFTCRSPEEVFACSNQIVELIEGEVKGDFVLIFDFFLQNEGFSPKRVFEQLNNLRVSEIISKYSWIHDTPFASRKRAKKDWDRIRRAALTSSGDGVRLLACPLCGGSLTIQFDPDSPQPNGISAGCLKINCPSCVSGTYWDGLEESPPWFNSTQRRIETQPNPVT